MEAVMSEIATGMVSQSALWFDDFSPILLPILGLMVFMVVASAFIHWLK